jgi:hypothetical protein
MAEFRKSDLISSDGLEVAAGTPGRKMASLRMEAQVVLRLRLLHRASGL